VTKTEKNIASKAFAINQFFLYFKASGKAIIPGNGVRELV